MMYQVNEGAAVVMYELVERQRFQSLTKEPARLAPAVAAYRDRLTAGVLETATLESVGSDLQEIADAKELGPVK